MKLHDLCGDTVRLDYPTLYYTAQVAVKSCLDRIYDYHHKVQDYGYGDVRFFMNAEYLEDEAKKLVKATETLAALEGMKERPKVEWRNRPIVIP